MSYGPMTTRVVILGGGTKASVDLFGLENNDLIPQVQDIITVGEFYEIAAGGQILFP